MHKAAAFGFADCDCCPPGTAVKQTVTHTTPLPVASRHAFLIAVRDRKMPRDVLWRIFEAAALVERRVVTKHQMSGGGASRRDRFAPPLAAPSDPFAADFAMMCLDADDAPP